jgi:hypothetical protein
MSKKRPRDTSLQYEAFKSAIGIMTEGQLDRMETLLKTTKNDVIMRNREQANQHRIQKLRDLPGVEIYAEFALHVTYIRKGEDSTDVNGRFSEKRWSIQLTSTFINIEWNLFNCEYDVRYNYSEETGLVCKSIRIGLCALNPDSEPIRRLLDFAVFLMQAYYP